MKRGVPPREYFTHERIVTRRALPPVLFHWTRSLESAVKILSDGFLHGRPGLSTSENPAFGTPGPVVFVLSPKSILSRGFTLWPYLMAPGYEQEAEWLVAAKDAEREGSHVMTTPVNVPLRGICRVVGYTPGWISRPAFHERVRALRVAARRANLPVRLFDWTRWWREGAVVARNPGRGRR